MVVVYLKSETEEEEFLLECACTVSIHALAESAAETHNLQSTIRRVSHQLRASYPDAPRSLLRVLSEAEAYTSKHQVLYKRPLLARMLRHHLQTIQKEAQSCMSVDISDTKDADEGNVQLWWAGKQLSTGKLLSDYIGMNEKTKIVVILKTDLSCKSDGVGTCQETHVPSTLVSILGARADVAGKESQQ